MQRGPKATLTTIALQAGFASASDFSRACKKMYGISPRALSRDRMLQDSKIRQDLPANAEYDFAKPPDMRNLDRFRVRLVDRPAQRIAYERVIGSFDAQRLLAGFDRLTAWARRHGLVRGAQLIGKSLDDPEITPMSKYHFDWCLVVPPGLERDSEVSFGAIPANRFAVVHCAGDVRKEWRAWQHLFYVWLPGSGYEPADAPMMEAYRRHPLELGWKTFDIDCCLPVRPLRNC
jgi:AraC family transcriptional regulator